MRVGVLRGLGAGVAVAAAGLAAGASFPVEEATIASVQAAYRARSATVREVVAAHLARIDAYDQQGPVLNSIVNVHPAALAEAEAMDRQLAALPAGRVPGGLLWGVPVVVKDNLDVVGVPMTSGFQGWKNFLPSGDAAVVEQLKAAGAIVVAKASLSEFARGGGDNINSVLPGFARNPYDLAHATGGSSGGTGAALAASFAVVGIGTDTGGSVRMPAAHNALAGLRPTVGVVSRRGVVPLDPARDTAGPMARTVEDLAVLMEAMTAVDPSDPATGLRPAEMDLGFRAALKADALRGARLGVLRQVFRPEVTDPAILANFERTLAELRAAGAEVVDPFVVPELDVVPRPPQTPSSFRTGMEAWFAAHPGVPYPSVAEIAASGLLHPLHQAATEAAVRALPAAEDPATLEGRRNEEHVRQAFRREMDVARVDALVFPTWAQLPARNGDRNTQLVRDPRPGSEAGPVRLRGSLTFVGSLLQWPAVSVPSGYAGSLPLGLQILGRAWDDVRVVGYAYAYERATGHRVPPPTVPALATSLTARFTGTWRLVRICERRRDGTVVPAARAAAGGQLVYAPNGRLSVQIVREGRGGATGSTADGFSSYFGRWVLDPAAGCVHHHFEGHLNPAQEGTSGPRTYTFGADGTLTLATPQRAPEAGDPLQVLFTWQRLP